MRISFGKLLFEEGDTLHIEDTAGVMDSLIAVKGHDCSRCEFCVVCDEKKDGNVIARFCKDTHFELSGQVKNR